MYVNDVLQYIVHDNYSCIVVVPCCQVGYLLFDFFLRRHGRGLRHVGGPTKDELQMRIGEIVGSLNVIRFTQLSLMYFVMGLEDHLHNIAPDLHCGKVFLNQLTANPLFSTDFADSIQ